MHFWGKVWKWLILETWKDKNKLFKSHLKSMFKTFFLNFSTTSTAKILWERRKSTWFQLLFLTLLPFVLCAVTCQQLVAPSHGNLYDVAPGLHQRNDGRGSNSLPLCRTLHLAWKLKFEILKRSCLALATLPSPPRGGVTVCDLVKQSPKKRGRRTVV